MTAANRPEQGLVLQPFRAARPAADADALARLLCPPYDVIDANLRATLVAQDPDNAVTVVLPDADGGRDPYQAAAQRLQGWVANGHYVVDVEPALYVYEMRDRHDSITRGLVGAVELRDPEDGVILPHENTMAGPVADRLALMDATDADVEPIFLVYDGGGAASHAVESIAAHAPLAQATTRDGITHTLWGITDAATHARIADDLIARRALIADGHHRYATYRELQQQRRAEHGAGPWDFGLTLLVDSTSYGPQVHAIHRVLRTLRLSAAVEAASQWGLTLTDAASPREGVTQLETTSGFAAVLTDGSRSLIVSDPSALLREASLREGEPEALARLDVTVLHRALVERVWGMPDSVDTVGYAHSVDEAIAEAVRENGTAVLLRPTPVADVAAVAAAGARMPRKSTLFTPKPASGLLMRRFADAEPAAPN